MVNGRVEAPGPRSRVPGPGDLRKTTDRAAGKNQVTCSTDDDHILSDAHSYRPTASRAPGRAPSLFIGLLGAVGAFADLSVSKDNARGEYSESDGAVPGRFGLVDPLASDH